MSQFRTSKGRQYGPYWYARVRSQDGKERSVYVGSDGAKLEIELAWEVVGEELAAAEASPEVRRLRELEARAGLARGPRGVVDVKIHDAKEVASARPK